MGTSHRPWLVPIEDRVSKASSSQAFCAPSSRQARALQHPFGGVLAKWLQRTSINTPIVLRGSRAAVLLDTIAICSGTTNGGAASMGMAVWKTGHAHIMMRANVSDQATCRAPDRGSPSSTASERLITSSS